MTGLPDCLFADQASPGPAVGSRADQLRKGRVEASGIAGTSLPLTLFRARRNRHITMGAVQVGRVMTNQRGAGRLAGSFELLLEVTPWTLFIQPEHAFGVTASPLHMRWNFLPLKSRPRLRAFAEASGGILLTTRTVPVRTTRFNFIDQAGFGLRLERTPRSAWLLGYRFQHISSGGRVKPNPGANANFIYAGISFLR